MSDENRVHIEPAGLGAEERQTSAEGSGAWREIPITPTVLRYVQRYGGRCRDCADSDGICAVYALPCEPDVADRAIAHVIAALNYGFRNGYLPGPSLPHASRSEVTASEGEVSLGTNS